MTSKPDHANETLLTLYIPQDLARLGRNVDDCLIIDNSPASYYFHPEYAIPVSSWFDDASDTELLDLIPFFDVMLQLDKVDQYLQSYKSV